MSYRKPTCPQCGKKTFEECGRLVCGMRKQLTATCPGEAKRFPRAGQKTEAKGSTSK